MDKEEISSLIKKNKVVLLIALLGIGFVVFGLAFPKNSQVKKDLPIVVERPEGSNTITKFKVDLSGAVKKPGVYEILRDSRVLDVVTAAGGFSDDADTSWIAKNINLALKVTDGQKIYINKTSDSVLSVAEVGSNTTNAKIDINRSSSTDIDSLPSVGPATVKKIVGGRPYKSIQELLDRKIVGNATFNKIKDLISAQ